jgi:hypothetical protein
MAQIEHKNAGALAGDGSMIKRDGDTVFVRYRLDVTQELLVPRPGTQLRRQRDIRGHIAPALNWPLGVEFVLQLEDGRRLKCWLDNHTGGVVCEYAGVL